MVTNIGKNIFNNNSPIFAFLTDIIAIIENVEEKQEVSSSYRQCCNLQKINLIDQEHRSVRFKKK